jgi:hypothetical protein
MYFSSTLHFHPDVHFDLRSKDTKGIYITIELFRLKAASLISAGYDGLAELATETHITSILVAADQIVPQAKFWSYLEPTHVRLDASYRDAL